MTLALHERRRAGANGTVPVLHDLTETPCREYPWWWDAPAHDAPRGRDLDRVLDARATCRQECPRLAACARYLAGWSHPDGVVAGQVWRDGVRLDRGVS